MSHSQYNKLNQTCQTFFFSFFPTDSTVPTDSPTMGSEDFWADNVTSSGYLDSVFSSGKSVIV